MTEDPRLPELHKFPSGVYTRLTKPPSQYQIDHYAALWEMEKDLFDEHILINLAWIAMLAERGILDQSAAAMILRELRAIEDAGLKAFPYDPSNGDVYFNLESAVISRLGEAIGGQLYTGRSRIDAYPTVRRLHARNQLVHLFEMLLELQRTILRLAEDHASSVMPGYTGFQAGQPWTFGHFMLSFFDAFLRDMERIEQTYTRLNMSLLGGAAGAGSKLDIDRDRVAAFLGCHSIIENSREWCTSADAFAEVVSTCSILLTHFGQLAHDLLIFSTREFGLIELGDDFSTTSSYMPQKKNPNALYNIRSVATGSVGYLPAVLSVMRTSSNDFDLGREALIGPLLRVLNDASRMSDYLRAALDTLTFHRELAGRRALEFWTASNEVASLLVDELGLAWRTAHRIVERFIRLALDENVPATEVTGDMLDRAAQEIIDRTVGISTEALRQALDPMEFLNGRSSVGSPKPEESIRMHGVRTKRLGVVSKWPQERKAELARSRQLLDRAIQDLLNSPS